MTFILLYGKYVIIFNDYSSLLPIWFLVLHTTSFNGSFTDIISQQTKQTYIIILLLYHYILTVYVAHAFRFQERPSYLAHGLQSLVVFVYVAAVDVGPLGPCKSHFGQLSGENFHHAIRLRVIVYGRTVALAPAQHHKVELAVARIHQVPGIPEFVELGVLEPFGRIAPVRLHQVLHVLNVDAVLGKHPVQLVDQIGQPELAAAAPVNVRLHHRPVNVRRHVPFPAVAPYGPHGRAAVFAVVVPLHLLLQRRPGARPLRRPRHRLLSLVAVVTVNHHRGRNLSSLDALLLLLLTDAFHTNTCADTHVIKYTHNTYFIIICISTYPNLYTMCAKSPEFIPCVLRVLHHQNLKWYNQIIHRQQDVPRYVTLLQLVP